MAFCLGWCMIALGIQACASSSSKPYQPGREVDRNPVQAERLNRQAADLITSEPARAEALLRDALTLDLYCGAAHNNLGVLMLNRGLLYEAAGEFEWARKLMPNQPDPRINLALVLERAGRTDEAIAAYETALEVQPEHIGAVQALTRLQLKSGKRNEHTRERLEAIALRGQSMQWREWAKTQLAQSGP